MIRKTFLIASLWVMPLSAQEDHRKPSPFPEKERNISSADRLKPEAPASRTKARSKGAVEGSESGGAPYRDKGEACFFSKRSDGGLTASGERLNSQEMVAAHATLPLQSRVKVTNVANGKTVEVRIIDRLPVSRRIISVSEAAAKELGFISSGTAEVKLDPVVN